MKKVAIYVRISTQMQHSDRQEEELTAFAVNENFEVVRIYKDVLSGFKNEEERPSLSSLLEDSKTNQFDIILFSEFSRLSRKVGDLTNLIEVFQNNNKELYFQKQNIWVKQKNDIGTSILIQVLGVVASYEIELFAERSVSGKISAIKNRGINEGGLPAYGYESEKGTKRLIVNNDEATVITRIFNLYADGYKQQYICDLLNSEKIKSPYKNRLEEANEKREQRGFEIKDYKNYDFDNLVWIPSSLNKVLKNELYKGVRKYKFHKPNPTKKNVEKEVIDEFEQYEESLQIIDNVLFERVQLMLQENRTNKDNYTKFENLLKPLLKCGCCNSNFAVSKLNDYHTYKCFGKVKDKFGNVKCSDSYIIKQDRLDGIVIQLSIRYIANNNLKNTSTSKIEQLINDNKQLQLIINSNIDKLNDNENNWVKYFNKAIKFNLSDSMIEDQKNEYDSTKLKLDKEIRELNKQVLNNNLIIESLTKMKDNTVLSSHINDIKNDRILLKELIYKYVTKIVVSSMNNKYSLVQITFIDSTEVWGSVKSAKYRNEELFYDELVTPTPEFISLLYINNNNTCKYNQATREFVYYGGNEDLKGVEAGTYSNSEFINILEKNNMNISFTDFSFNREI